MILNIKNYKTIRDSSITLVENQVNYLIGSNESGKTNILNAVSCLGKNSIITINPSEDRTSYFGKLETEEISFEFSYENDENISNYIDESLSHI